MDLTALLIPFLGSVLRAIFISAGTFMVTHSYLKPKDVEFLTIDANKKLYIGIASLIVGLGLSFWQKHKQQQKIEDAKSSPTVIQNLAN